MKLVLPPRGHVCLCFSPCLYALNCSQAGKGKLHVDKGELFWQVTISQKTFRRRGGRGEERERDRDREQHTQRASEQELCLRWAAPPQNIAHLILSKCLLFRQHQLTDLIQDPRAASSHLGPKDAGQYALWTRCWGSEMARATMGFPCAGRHSRWPALDFLLDLCQRKPWKQSLLGPVPQHSSGPGRFQDSFQGAGQSQVYIYEPEPAPQ